MTHEEALIRAFFEPARGSRLMGLLETPDGREQLREELAEVRGLESRYCRKIPVEEQHPEGIERLLRTMGAEEHCVLISEDEDLDGLELLLTDALEWVVGWGVTTFVSCVPGTLAYFEGGESGERFVLERRTGDDEG